MAVSMTSMRTKHSLSQGYALLLGLLSAQGLEVAGGLRLREGSAAIAGRLIRLRGRGIWGGRIACWRVWVIRSIQSLRLLQSNKGSYTGQAASFCQACQQIDIVFTSRWQVSL